MGKNTVQAKQWLEKCYGDFAPSEITIKRWSADFKRGRRDTDDAERSGCSNEAVTPENIKKIRKIILNDRKVKLCELTDMVKISKERVGFILHEHLSIRKLCSEWVSRLLTVDQKQQRVDDSEQCLAMFKRNKPEFLRRYVTMDETWIHYFTPESKRSSSEWTATGEPRPKRPKAQ
ncbi:PREDICTED: putative uncharacterized protein FLJ37770 [Polistes dominula]|uniref:Transposase n=1 Tax=Polistes dominula TaxID=743375 RepID=A0ABM1J9A6_POLDO|nr:PREDICTED: putative uncharacterized protein FLJ37770 [Polistes dominula]